MRVKEIVNQGSEHYFFKDNMTCQENWHCHLLLSILTTMVYNLSQCHNHTFDTCTLISCTFIKSNIFLYAILFFQYKESKLSYGCCSPLQLILEGNFIFVNNRILGAASMYNKTMQNNEFPNLIIILCLFSNFFGYSIYYLCPRTSLF